MPSVNALVASDDATPIEQSVATLFAWGLEDFERPARLRRRALELTPAIAVERSRLLVDFLRRDATESMPALLRRARSLAHILRHLDTPVFDDELLVGSTTEHEQGCAIYPELHGAAIWPELASLPNRAHQPVDVSGDALAELGLEIFPFFMETNVHDWSKARGDDDGALGLMERWIFFLVSLPNGVSHVLPDYAAVVENGLEHAIAQMRARVGAGEGGDEAATFLRAAEICARSVIELAHRYADRCESLAAREERPHRRAELLAAAAALRHVPARPARTFREGLQAVWITHVALLQECSELAVNFGRLDQYLGPLLERDLRVGRLDLHRALELALCFYVKANDHAALIPTAGRRLFGGGATDQSITLSGVTADGTDATNLASYLFLRAIDLLQLREPNVDARLHRGSPDLWYERTLEVIGRTGATPALYNDDAIVPALMAKGTSLQDARDYGVIGCVEPAACGKTYGSTGSILLNLAGVLELTLHDGVHPRSGSRIGPASGRLSAFESFDEAWAAFSRQLRFMVERSVTAEHCYERSHEELLPSPLLSTLIDGTIAAGRDVTAGGATYDVSGVWVLGLADVVDSLVAMQKLVFREGRISPRELERALRANFVGHEKIRALCTHRAPKYGTDDDDADAMAVRVTEAVDAAYARHGNYRGGAYHVGYWSMTTHVGAGELIEALPSGRLRGTSLASGATPVSGVARRGPSAALCSTAKLPPEAIANGIANNHKVPASLLAQPGKAKALERLVRGFFAKGGMQLQFVVADRDTLRAALDDPALAKELLVRVSGYTAYFGDLDRDMQEEIVNRTEDLF